MSHTAAQGFEMMEAGQRQQPHRANRFAAGQFGAMRESPRTLSKRRIGDVEMVELHVGRNGPTGPGNIRRRWICSGQHRLGRWLKDTPKIPLNGAVRALAVLERIWHGRRRRFDGPFDQRHAVYPGVERGAEVGVGDGRDFPLEGRPQHAGPARGTVRLSRDAGLCASGPGSGTPETGAVYGSERDDGGERE